MNKILRLIGCLILAFFVTEVLEPSTIFVRADAPLDESSTVVFHVHRVHYHRHINFLIRPDQEKESDRNSRNNNDKDQSHRRPIISHYATVPVRCLTVTVVGSTQCEPPSQIFLDSLPPTSQIRPPSVTS